jgi:sulfur carrier protein ThiS
MLIKVKLYSALQRYKPEVPAGQPFEVEVPEKSSVRDLIALLGIRPNEVKVTYVNDRARAEIFRLRTDDEVGIFPPIGGG